MQIKGAELVARYHCEFDENEVPKLRAMLFLPPTCSVPAPLSLTEPEILDVFVMLGVTTDDARKQLADALRPGGTVPLHERILELAYLIGAHWRDQSGVNAAYLDELATLTGVQR